MARLYSNENFPFPAVEELRRLGHDNPDYVGLAQRIHTALEAPLQTARLLLRINRPMH